MIKKRFLIAIVSLILAIGISFGLPKPKYKSPDFVAELSVPASFYGWRSKDASGSLNLEDERYKFVSNAFARHYLNKFGEPLLFIILDAGNFHNPKVCFGSSGFTIKEMPDLEIALPHHKVRAKLLYVEKPDEKYLLVYWISINKKVVDWAQQKLIQLWYSLFAKQKVGLMVRLDIPLSSPDTSGAIKLAKEFLTNITPLMPSDQAEYIFGKYK